MSRAHLSMPDDRPTSGGRVVRSPGRFGALRRTTRVGCVVTRGETRLPVISAALASGELKSIWMSLKDRASISWWGLVGHGFSGCSEGA
jgi:hypothetical protein